MPVNPIFGESAGQNYDLERAIKTFLQQMAEGCPNVAPAVIKELLQNADDAGASQVEVILDERTPPSGLPQEYAGLYQPALLVRNNAPFKLGAEVDPGDKDDFAALCDVASGHKRAQAVAAGRFGIGFNSVYFLTDTPVLFSRREVHVFDILHHIFSGNGWRFDLDQFPAAAESGAGPVKNALEWMLPKKALGEAQAFGDFAMSSVADYRQALLRLPLRQQGPPAKALYVDTFRSPKERRSAFQELVVQTARSMLFLKNVEAVTFATLDDVNFLEEVDRVQVSPSPQDFHEFIQEVKEWSDEDDCGPELSCAFQRVVSWSRAGATEAEWTYHVKHSARFDDSNLNAIRLRLKRNEERAVPWVSLAIPEDSRSMRLDGTELPSWRVFLPLNEPGPCGCVLSAALFVGPSRQKSEFRTDGADEALRKTQWNTALVKNGLVPLLSDASLEVLELLPVFLANHPKDYLSLFPSVRRSQDAAESLSDLFRDAFNEREWMLHVPDIWDRPVELVLGTKGDEAQTGVRLETVPDWLSAYGDRFEYLSSETRYFVRFALGAAIRERVVETDEITVDTDQSDVARAVLADDAQPAGKHLKQLLDRLGGDEEALTPRVLEDLWCFQEVGSEGGLLRFAADDFYLYPAEGEESGVLETFSRLRLEFDGTHWVVSDVGLTAVDEGKRQAVRNILPGDGKSALEMLRRVGPRHGHDSIPNTHEVVPLVDFLCGIAPHRLTADLRLSFLVRTANQQHGRRATGMLAVKPAVPSNQDEDVWEVFFKAVLPELDPACAEHVQRIISHAPHLIGCLSEPDCEIVVARHEDSLAVMLRAQTSDPTTSARLQKVMDRHGSLGARARPSVERAVSLLFSQAERQWDDLESPCRAAFLALPVHRRANGEYGPLVEDGDEADDLARRFRLQSEEDVRDAPIQLETVTLLQVADPAIKRFYRTRLGLEEQNRVAVLKQVLSEVGCRDDEDTNVVLLKYLAKHLRESVESLEDSPHSYDQTDADELGELLSNSRSVLCTDGVWRSAAECVDAKDVAQRLVPQGRLAGRKMDGLISELFSDQRILSTRREIGPEVRRMHALAILPPSSLANRALSSTSPELDLSTRIEILLGSWEDRPDKVVNSPSPEAGPDEVVRAPSFAEFSVPGVVGRLALDGAESVPPRIERELPWLVALLVPRRICRDAFAEEFHVPQERLGGVLRLVGVDLVREDELNRRLVDRFYSLWPTVNHGDRLRILQYVGDSGLAGNLSSVAQRLDVVHVEGTPAWVLPAQVVAPPLLSKDPPLLRPTQFPKIPDEKTKVGEVWDVWCGIRDLGALAREVCERAASLPTERRDAAGKKVLEWIEKLTDASEDHFEAVRNAFSPLAWVPATRGSQKGFRPPEDVLVHKSGDLLRHEFWVPSTRLPDAIAGKPELWGFVTEPVADRETLEKIARVLGRSKDAPKDQVLAAYKAVLACIDDNPELSDTWRDLSEELPVFRLFRDPDRVVSARQLFLGDSGNSRDLGEALFCLNAEESLPRGIEKRYRDLEVEATPSAKQLVLALSSLTSKDKRVKQTHGQLVRALKGLGEDRGLDDDELKLCRVRTCGGEYRALQDCVWDDELGLPGFFAQEVEGGVVDGTDRSSAEFCSWLRERFPGLVCDLRVLASPEIQEPVDAASMTPTLAQVLGPWRDWLAELARTDSWLRHEATSSGLSPPETPIEILPVERIPVRYVLDETVFSLSPDGVGPVASHDCGSRILVRRHGAEESYETPAGLEAFDRRVVAQLTCLLCAGRYPTPEETEKTADLIGETLERPSVTLKRIEKNQSGHFFHQYHDQVADPDFADLFERYQRTMDGTSLHGKLHDQMWAILKETYVEARREQIRGHGYDEFSVFAELLQNAEDAYVQRRHLGMEPASSRHALFAYRSNGDGGVVLSFEHFGRPFNYWRHGAKEVPQFSRDVEGVLRSAGSFKGVNHQADPTQKPVGRFGLGFKSVYLLTDAPRIHSGSWHFEIEAGCLPREVTRPGDLPEGATRVEAPLRSGVSEVEDHDGARLTGLLPFLREIDRLELRNTNGADPVALQSIAQPLVGSGNGTVHAVEVGGGRYVPGGAVRFLRVRHPEHAGQLAVCLDENGLPTPWSEAFDADLYAALPLKTHLGAGVGVSHLFEIQSGRTHLVDPAGNAPRFGEVAALVGALPAAFESLSDSDERKTAVLNRFWALWRWDAGDEETSSLRRILAKEVAGLPNAFAVVPLLFGRPPTTLGTTPVVSFSNVPDEIQQILIEEDASVLVGSDRQPTGLANVHVAPESFTSAYRKACRCGGMAPDGAVTRLDWEQLGDGFKQTEALARNPSLLNRMAEALSELDDDKQDTMIRSWLSECPVAVDGVNNEEPAAVPRKLLRPDFKGRPHLPARCAPVLSAAYSEKAIALLARIGLRSLPSGIEIRTLIESGDLSQKEAEGVLRYLADEDRFMNQAYRELADVLATPWFPAGDQLLSGASAAVRFMADDVAVWGSVFNVWLGIREPGFSPLPPELESRRVDPARTLALLHQWWLEHGDVGTREYEQLVYPRGTVPALRTEFFSGDRNGRKQWLTLFVLGALHTLGRTTPGQHRTFLERCEDNGWMDVFADPDIRADQWMGVLEHYLDDQVDQSLYYLWMQQFLRIFQLAKWLAEYVEAFLAIDLVREPFSLSQILDTRTSALFDGGGASAPPLGRTLGNGASFIVRELSRLGIIRNPLAHRFCYVPAGQVRDLLVRLGCPDHFGDYGDRAAQSPAAYEFLLEHLGAERATFGGSFDVPLILVARDRKLQERFLGETLPPDDEELN